MKSEVWGRIEICHLQRTMLFLFVSSLPWQVHLYSSPCINEKKVYIYLWLTIFHWLLEIFIWMFYRYLKCSTSEIQLFFPSKHAVFPIFSSQKGINTPFSINNFSNSFNSCSPNCIWCLLLSLRSNHITKHVHVTCKIILLLYSVHFYWYHPSLIICSLGYSTLPSPPSICSSEFL